MDQPAFVKTSPRGSGRHQKRTRSQDRYGLQQQQHQKYTKANKCQTVCHIYLIK